MQLYALRNRRLWETFSKIEVYRVYIIDMIWKNISNLCVRERIQMIGFIKLKTDRTRSLNISKNREILIIRVPISFS